jgi:type I restriction enzyme S subunit
VVTGRYGTLGRVYFIREDFWPHNTTLFVRNFHGNDPRFVYYLLDNIDLATHSAVSAVPGLNRNDIHRLPVMLPPLPTQRRIAEILGRLDDKIEANRRINRTLEAMAQALYRHWFVEFGPFRDGEFVESEVGAIPKRWEVVRLGDVARTNELSIRNGHEPNRITYVDISSVSACAINSFAPMVFVDAPSRARRLVKHGDTIWSAVRPNRRSFCLIQHPPEGLVVSTGFVVLSPTKVPYSFLYCLLTNTFAKLS